jgi:hypothetical protein
MRRLVVGIAFATCLSPSSAALAQAWDAAPLRSATPVPRDGLPPERGQFLSWLERQGSALAPDRAQAAQERLYMYISALAKQRNGQFPASGDAEAARLFRLAAALGDPGALHVMRHLDADTAQLPPRPIVRDARLTFAPPLFTFASSDERWSICYPYYFMAAPAGRQTLANGVATDVLVLSTLFAPDRGPIGSSQATILMTVAVPRDSAKHVALWRAQLGVAPAKAPSENRRGDWYASPPGEEMNRLVVVRRLPDAVVVLAYVGLGGTFEANRPHFLDLVDTLGSSRCAT